LEPYQKRHLNIHPDNPNIYVIIPAFNEEESIGLVLSDIPWDVVKEVIVVSNGSTDTTVAVARKGGAVVLEEPQKGYGKACLKGLEYLSQLEGAERPDVVVFLDGDYSDYPEELKMLIEPILKGESDMVIGSRATGEREQGSMMPQQIFGNWLATSLIRLMYKVDYTDLGPFRAISYDRLLEIGMVDENFGWTVEMQVKAAKKNMRFAELPVRYRKRVGVSKVTGTIYGTVMAGYKIIYTIFKYR